MRNFLLFGITLLILVGFNKLDAQDIVNIPDANFKQALLKHTPIVDTDGDGEISKEEAKAFDGALNVSNKSIQNLTGIEAFVNIKRLYASENNISGVLDFSNNTALERLNCNSNQITGVDISKCKALTRLGLNVNQLQSIDLSANVNLERLWLYYNQLESVDVSNMPNLEHLAIDNNKLTSLDISENKNLLTLGVYFNQLTSIDISNNERLYILNAWNNDFTSVNVANGNNANMTRMKVHNNPKLTCIQIDAGFDPESNACTGVNGQEGWCKDETAEWNTDCPTTSIKDDILGESKVNLYPNPAQNKVILTLDRGTLNYVKVYNIQGAKVLESTGTVLNLETLTSGVYFVKIFMTNNSVICKKLVKE